MVQIQYNKDMTMTDKVIVNTDSNFVYYYDKDNDIVIVNDCQTVFDKDKDKDNVNVYLDKDIDFVLNNNVNYTLIDNVTAIRKANDIINDSQTVIDDIKVKYHSINNKVYDIKDFDINTLTDIVFDSQTFLLSDNVSQYKDKDSQTDFVCLTMNKDIYKYIEYDFKSYIVFSYVRYNYDNDNVFVIFEKSVKDFVITNINYNVMSLKLKKTINFIYSQILNEKTLFNKLKAKHDDLFLCKDIDSIKQRNYVIKAGKAKLRTIAKYQSQLKDINKNIKDFDMLRQYIVKNNVYYNCLNDLKNDFYKSFKDSTIEKTVKDKVLKLNDKVKDFDFDRQSKYKDFDIVKDFDFDKDFDLISYYDFDIVTFKNDFDKDFVKANKLLKSVFNDNTLYKSNKYVFKDIINDFEDKQSQYIIFKRLCLYYKDSQSLTDFVNDILNDIDIDNYNDIDNVIDSYKALLLRFNIDIDFVNFYVKAIVSNKDLKDIDSLIIELNNIILNYSVVIELLVSFTDNKDINDYNIYDKDIFDSPMNKHRSIIKKEQSDFLKVAYDKNLNDFYTTE